MRVQQPFFGQADLIELGALDLPDVASIVQEGFDSTGKDAGVGPSRIVELCQGHPQRSMQVADALWRATLEDQGFAWRQETKWRIVDPQLRDWTRRQFS